MMDLDFDPQDFLKALVYNNSNYDESEIKNTSCDKLSNDAQHQILMGYPLYLNLLNNLKITKNKLTNKSKSIEKLKGANLSLSNELAEARGALAEANAALAVSLSDVERLNENMQLQMEKYKSEKDFFAAQLATNELLARQMKFKYQAKIATAKEKEAINVPKMAEIGQKKPSAKRTISTQTDVSHLELTQKRNFTSTLEFEEDKDQLPDSPVSLACDSIQSPFPQSHFNAHSVASPQKLEDEDDEFELVPCSDENVLSFVETLVEELPVEHAEEPAHLVGLQEPSEEVSANMPDLNEEIVSAPKEITPEVQNITNESSSEQTMQVENAVSEEEKQSLDPVYSVDFCEEKVDAPENSPLEQPLVPSIFNEPLEKHLEPQTSGNVEKTEDVQNIIDVSSSEQTLQVENVVREEEEQSLDPVYSVDFCEEKVDAPENSPLEHSLVPSIFNEPLEKHLEPQTSGNVEQTEDVQNIIDVSSSEPTLQVENVVSEEEKQSLDPDNSVSFCTEKVDAPGNSPLEHSLVPSIFNELSELQTSGYAEKTEDVQNIIEISSSEQTLQVENVVSEEEKQSLDPDNSVGFCEEEMEAPENSPSELTPAPSIFDELLEEPSEPQTSANAEKTDDLYADKLESDFEEPTSPIFSPKSPEENEKAEENPALIVKKDSQSRRKHLLHSLFGNDVEELDQGLFFSGPPTSVAESEDSDSEVTMVLREMTTIPSFMQPLPLTPKLVMPNRKRKTNVTTPVPEKTSKVEENVELLELLEDCLRNILENPISPLPPSDNEEGDWVVENIEEKQPMLLSDVLNQKKCPSDVKGVKKKLKCGSYILANDFFKQNLKCIAVDDANFCPEMLLSILETARNTPLKVTREILARSFILAVIDGRKNPLVANQEPFALTCSERRVIFLTKRLEESSDRWSKLSAAIIKEATMLLLSFSLPKINFKCKLDEAVISSLTRLIAALAMLISEPSYAKGLIQLACLYVPHRVVSIGSVLVESWPCMIDTNLQEDALLLDALYHSCQEPAHKKKMLEVLRKCYGADLIPAKTFDVASLYGAFPLQLMQSSNTEDKEGSTLDFSPCQ
ncbi:uncharacterized protein LOC135946863 [Cloeon dipterum]|uniref:uncharacterized protein LOC135946863 n=1 Tax=Cloeon dipterum TaxID=197152 RepID=UPI00321FAD48